MVKLSVVLIFIGLLSVHGEKLEWDLALVVDNEIQLLSANGSILYSRKPFTSLKAITYDGIRDQFVVSDMDNTNDTIFTVKISKEAATEPIIKEPPGDVQGLAMDPLEDILYWTNAINNTINYVTLNNSLHIPQEFIAFSDVVPHAIAIDICNRYMYYTNPSGSKPTIERRKLDNNSDHQILVDDTIITPVGLAIDYKEQRLYWADSRIGSSAGRIESITLDGRDRRVVVERNTMEPFGIAIDEEAIYWTDTNNQGLYKFSKAETKPDTTPEKIASFTHIPMGLISNSVPNDCKSLADVIEEYQHETKELNHLAPDDSAERILRCLNGGTMKDGRCDCARGFSGVYCEMSICNVDYCLNGNCYLASSGKPMCNCDKGYVGYRCQAHKCASYCLNDGECILTSPRNLPKCNCLQGYIGNRCEYNEEVCNAYCSGRSNGLVETMEVMCRCSHLLSGKNISMPFQSSLHGEPGVLSKLQDPIVYLSMIITMFSLVIIALIVYINVIKKRRPRIKKRIIVNKNVTPLTDRPQQRTEQCEITIENCCNMNICETPCFEPTAAGEDKKKLITNMEGEDLY